MSVSMVRTVSDSGRAPSPRAVVVVLASAGITAALTQTVIVPLIGQLPAIFSTSAVNASWIVTVTLLAAAVATPILGRLADMFGRKRVLSSCSVILVCGSLVCALSTSIVPMVTGRALQGIGMAMIPVGVSAMRTLLPPHRLNSGVAIMSASLGTGAALGLPLSALIVELTGWQALFYGSATLGAVVGALVWRAIPSDRPARVGRFDLPGALGLTVALVSLLLVVSNGRSWGWSAPVTVSLAVVSVLVAVIWVLWERRCVSPLIDVRATARRPLVMINLASMAVGFAMYGQTLVIPQILQAPVGDGVGLGQSMLAAGLWMVPGGIMMLVVSPVSGRMSTAFGPKASLALGSSIIAAGYVAGQFLMGSVWGLSLTGGLIMTGVAFAYGAMPVLIMSQVPSSGTAVANGVNSVVRMVGSAVSASVAGAILAASIVEAVPTETAFRTCLAVAAGAGVLAALLALAVPVGRRQPSRRRRRRARLRQNLAH